MLGGLFLCCRLNFSGCAAFCLVSGWYVWMILDGWMVVLGVGGFLFGW